jgi:hypothetical protein
MDTKEVMLDTRGRLMFFESGTSIQEIIDLVDSHFTEIPEAIRYERIVIQGPFGSEPQGVLYASPRETTFFLTDTECRLPAYHSLAQIIDSATTRPNCNLAKMGLVIPYGSPNALTIHVRD